MADILFNIGKRKRLSTRIDLTPMVDLGFLLITFFIFTTTLLKPSTMEVFMPKDEPTPFPTVVKDYCAMKIFIGQHHQLYYLTGEDAMKNNVSQLHLAKFEGNETIRQALIQHVKNVREAIATKQKGTSNTDKPFILIKPTNQSQYNDMVDIIDEIHIAGIEQYALLDINEDEKNMIAKR